MCFEEGAPSVGNLILDSDGTHNLRNQKERCQQGQTNECSCTGCKCQPALESSGAVAFRCIQSGRLASIEHAAAPVQTLAQRILKETGMSLRNRGVWVTFLQPCQRRLNFDPVGREIAEVKPTHLASV